MPIVRILEHGQVTIPKKFRDMLGLKKGDLAEAELEGDRIMITPKTLTAEKEAANTAPKARLPERLPERLTNPRYGSEQLDARLEEMATSAPGIETVRQITKRLPSLSKLISEERDNE